MEVEDYVTLETAKVLQEQGFKEPAYGFWAVDEDREEVLHQTLDALKFVEESADWDARYQCGYLAPTLSQAQKWYRRQEVEVNASWDSREGHWFYFAQHFNDFPEWADISDSIYDTYEEALDAGLRIGYKHIFKEEEKHGTKNQ